MLYVSELNPGQDAFSLKKGSQNQVTSLSDFNTYYKVGIIKNERKELIWVGRGNYCFS